MLTDGSPHMETLDSVKASQLAVECKLYKLLNNICQLRRVLETQNQLKV